MLIWYESALKYFHFWGMLFEEYHICFLENLIFRLLLAILSLEKLENVKNFLLKIPTICNSYQMNVKSLYKIPCKFLILYMLTQKIREWLRLSQKNLKKLKSWILRSILKIVKKNFQI